jgi:hypothetical protein
MKVLLPVVAVLVSATAATAWAPTAHADPNDAQFLQNVRNGMGGEITDAQATIDSAHGLCSELKNGKTYDQVVLEVRQANQYWDADEAAFFVSASAQAYCPELVGG